jgi:hypothetical protein
MVNVGATRFRSRNYADAAFNRLLEVEILDFPRAWRNWRGRFKRKCHHLVGAGNPSPSSIWRATSGFRTPSGRALNHVQDQDGAAIVRRHASQHLPHPRRAGADDPEPSLYASVWGVRSIPTSRHRQLARPVRFVQNWKSELTTDTAPRPCRRSCG